MIFKRFFGSTRQNDPIAWSLYEAAVNQAREPAFYRDLGVPDTLDGRFELISLHVFLILRRLKEADQGGGQLGQDLFDAMFSDMDRSLREMGAGDLGVAPRVKKMAKAFYGRTSAYETALVEEAEPADLEEALLRNVYGTVDSPTPAVARALTDYVRRELANMSGQPLDALRRGVVWFGAPPEIE